MNNAPARRIPDVASDVDERSPRELVWAVIALSRRNQVTLVAAGLAYYSFTTLVPFLLVLVMALGAVGRLELLLSTLTSLQPGTPAWTQSILQHVGRSTNRARFVAIAGVVFLWSALRAFRAVKGSFSEVYDTRSDESVLAVFRDAILVFLTVALAVALLAAVGVALTFAFDGIAVGVLAPVFLFLALTVLFLPMYYTFPAADVGIREVVPGATVAAGSWTAASLGFRYYAATTNGIELYGVAGGVLLVLTWLYIGGFVLLQGAVVNALLAGRVNPETEG